MDPNGTLPKGKGPARIGTSGPLKLRLCGKLAEESLSGLGLEPETSGCAHVTRYGKMRILLQKFFLSKQH